MADFFKEEIDHVGDRLEKAIKLSGKEIDKSVNKISKELEITIDKLSNELHSHRNLTKDDLHELIDYASNTIGVVIDDRIGKLKRETAELITHKVQEVREQLTSAANEQKKTAVRNVSVAVVGSLIIGTISIASNKINHGEISLVDIFRAIMLALTAGYAIWIGVQLVFKYLGWSKEKKNTFIVGLQYIDVLRPKGVAGHIGILVLLIIIWLFVFYKDSILAIIK